jgi:hypothetical protein
MAAVNSLPPAEAKAIVVERTFDRLAPRYDRVNRCLHSAWTSAGAARCSTCAV